MSNLNLYNACYLQLTGDSTVGGLVSTRVYEGSVPTDMLPFIVIDVEEEEDNSVTPLDAPHYLATIQVVTSTAKQRDVLGKAVKAAINRQVWTNENVVIVSSLLTNETSSNVSDSGNADKTYFISDQTYSIIAST